VAGVTFASTLKEDGSFIIPEEAVDSLGLHPGDEIRVHIETAGLSSHNQAYYEQKLTELIQEADRIKCSSAIQTTENTASTFGELLKEKYRKQGFDF
jgi:antitoxin component of MazEF toxin-antitoxin module